jgi:apolipoprotein N-acyltransferase
VLATVGARRGGVMALVNYGAGLIYFLVNMYWLAMVTPLGYGGVCFYLGFYFVLCGYILRQIYLHLRWPFTLVLPTIWVGQEYLRAVVMTGFPWFFLSHSQHERVWLIQVSDTLGAYGVTFLVAMVNGLICDLLLRPLVSDVGKKPKMRRSLPTPHKKPGHIGPVLSAGTLILLTGCCMAGALLYGQWRYKQGDDTITTGPTVAVIQENIPQYVKESGQSDEDIFEKHRQLTKEAWNVADELKPGLIVWPETMTCSYLNAEFMYIRPELLNEIGQAEQAKCRRFDIKLREITRGDPNKMGPALLVGTPALEIESSPDGSIRSKRYNSALLYPPGGSRQKDDIRYDKMHLVPFGEVVPFRESWPWLYRTLNNLTPYDYEYTLEAGKEPTVFTYQVPDMEEGEITEKTWRFAVAICYEDVMPQVPRRLTVEDDAKRIDFLLNISNDGWFVTGGKDSPIKPTSELMQHLVFCKFRAVENRIGIARAVNTGISAFIRPDGVVQDGKLVGTLDDQARKRQAVAGFLADTIYLDDRVSFYSRYGDLFAQICAALLGGLFLAAVSAHRRGTKILAR